MYEGPGPALKDFVESEMNIEDSVFARSHGRVLLEMEDGRNFNGFISRAFGSWVLLVDSITDRGRETERDSFVNLDKAKHVVADVRGYEKM